MKKIFLSAAFCAVAFAACSDGGKIDPMLVMADAMVGGPTIDADVAAVCNVVTQQGCEANQKCAQVVARTGAEGVTQLFKIECVPDGAITEGQACVYGPDGPMGFDNCVAGFTCLGTCVEVCSTMGDTCRTDEEAFGTGNYCSLISELFADGSSGICSPGCFPAEDTIEAGIVVNEACGEGNGCYFNGVAGDCANVPTNALMKRQNDIGYGPEPGAFFSNGCASGFSLYEQDTMGNAICARSCKPVDSYAENADMATGMDGRCGNELLQIGGGGDNAPGASHECRFYNNSYGNTETVSDKIGFCIPLVNGMQSCSDFPWTEYEGILKNAVATNMTADELNLSLDTLCGGDMRPNCSGTRGCVSEATFVAAFAMPGMGGMAFRTDLMLQSLLSNPTASSETSLQQR